MILTVFRIEETQITYFRDRVPLRNSDFFFKFFSFVFLLWNLRRNKYFLFHFKRISLTLSLYFCVVSIWRLAQWPFKCLIMAKSSLHFAFSPWISFQFEVKSRFAEAGLSLDRFDLFLGGAKVASSRVCEGRANSSVKVRLWHFGLRHSGKPIRQIEVF